MSTSHGPFLTYIVRNEQQQKLTTAARARLASNVTPEVACRPRWLRRWCADNPLARFRSLIRQFGAAFRGSNPIGYATGRMPQNEAMNLPDPRLSS